LALALLPVFSGGRAENTKHCVSPKAPFNFPVNIPNLPAGQ